MAAETSVPTYYDVLRDVHRQLHPKRYLEIGVHKGFSLAFVQPGTHVVAVDPEPLLENDPPPDTTVLATTSDEFFRSPALSEHRQPFELVFVDGLHLFEQALADILNAEQLCTPSSVILVHDVLPIDGPTSTRERNTLVWTGDVWKAVVALRKHRTDLSIATLDAGPSGLAVITGLGGPASADRSWFDDAVTSLLPETFDDLQARGADQALNVVPATSEQVHALLGVADR